MGESSLTYYISEPNPGSGNVLVIQLDKTAVAGSQIALQIFYSTQQTSNALTWLTPAQTAGGVYPYMFSQCEDINCRSVAPLQDTPSVKYTYGACVTVEKELSPYMSANITTVTPAANTNYTITCFIQQIPIADYLIAIAIGNI